MIFGPGNNHIWELLRKQPDAEAACRAVSDGQFVLNAHEAANLKQYKAEDADAVIEKCINKNIHIYTYECSGYPDILKTIFNPPAVLYCIGDMECFNNNISLTVVGTRHPSSYGIRTAGNICSELAKCGFNIVSGFADGIDSASHRAALAAGGRTSAVLGCGVDVDYPKINSDIRSAVAEHGAVISEFVPGTPPNGRNFPVRNRILSGISLGVFVAEAPVGSGALITADYAIEQGRDVFCIPPADIFDKKYSGVVKYLRDGAIPVFGYTDIMYEYYTTFSHKLSSLTPEDEYSQSVSETAVFSKPEKNKVHSDSVTAAAELPSVNISDLTEVQKSIVQILGHGAVSVNDLYEKTDTETSELLTELTELELIGAVRSLPGKIYELCCIMK